MTKLTDQLKTARGKRYYDILKLILVDVGPQIVADAQQIAIDTGKLTVLDIGRMAVKYDLNYRATCEWLEESRVLPAGAYQRLKDNGLKVGEVLAAAKAELRARTR